MTDDDVYVRLAEMQDEIRDRKALMDECWRVLSDIANWRRPIWPIWPRTYKAILRGHAAEADWMRGKIEVYERTRRLNKRA